MEQLQFQNQPITPKMLKTLSETKKQSKAVQNILYIDCKGPTAFCINFDKLSHHALDTYEQKQDFFSMVHRHIVNQGWKPLNQLGQEKFLNTVSMKMYFDFSSNDLDKLIKNISNGSIQEKIRSQIFLKDALIKYCEIPIELRYEVNTISLYIINEFNQLYLLGVINADF